MPQHLVNAELNYDTEDKDDSEYPGCLSSADDRGTVRTNRTLTCSTGQKIGESFTTGSARNLAIVFKVSKQVMIYLVRKHERVRQVSDTLIIQKYGVI